MYSEVFGIRFESQLLDVDRLRLLTTLITIPDELSNGSGRIYWTILKTNGYAEFYSSHPDVTQLIESRLTELESVGHLSRRSPGLPSALRFTARVAGGFLLGVTRALFGK